MKEKTIKDIDQEIKNLQQEIIEKQKWLDEITKSVVYCIDREDSVGELSEDDPAYTPDGKKITSGKYIAKSTQVRVASLDYIDGVWYVSVCSVMQANEKYPRYQKICCADTKTEAIEQLEKYLSWIHGLLKICEVTQ